VVGGGGAVAGACRGVVPWCRGAVAPWCSGGSIPWRGAVVAAVVAAVGRGGGVVGAGDCPGGAAISSISSVLGALELLGVLGVHPSWSSWPPWAS
jgi:hypothetical protein